MTPDYWDKAKRHLSKADPVLGKIIKQYKGELMTSRGDSFYTLSRSIVGQQISVKSADAVWNRLAKATGKTFTPRGVLKLDDTTLRAVGLSGQKVKYLREIAEFFKKSEPDWHSLEDEEILKALTGIKGVGNWTAEMFMIFHLQRPDIFPIADLGALKAVYRHYNKAEKMDKAAVLELAETWRPYRSVATWYLWRALDPVPVEY